ncbi:histidine-rich glycoprotein-like [Musca domestica]|uniref:Histidine-rich glycoprotein-like n=1 Tax=Musca domestica TaxID=7370 RepID=A0A9J7D5X6_MUSDO|nr:histidine-rich glycoprotein-like [Musca domestica]
MKVLACVLVLAVTSAQAGFWPNGNQVGGFQGGDAQVDLTTKVVVDTQPAEQHPVYHHAEASAVADIGFVDNHHGVAADDVRNAPAVKIIQHEPIHQIEPVHHVTRVLHHEPHHFLHYTNPVVDHHVIHSNHHSNEHRNAADLHYNELHHGDAAYHGEVYHSDVFHNSGTFGNSGIVHHADVSDNNPAVVFHADIHKHSAVIVKPLRQHKDAIVTKIFPAKKLWTLRKGLW